MPSFISSALNCFIALAVVAWAVALVWCWPDESYESKEKPK